MDFIFVERLGLGYMTWDSRRSINGVWTRKESREESRLRSQERLTESGLRRSRHLRFEKTESELVRGTRRWSARETESRLVRGTLLDKSQVLSGILGSIIRKISWSRDSTLKTNQRSWDSRGGKGRVDGVAARKKSAKPLKSSNQCAAGNIYPRQEELVNKKTNVPGFRGRPYLYPLVIPATASF